VALARVVLDTNVLVAGLRSRHGASALLLDLVGQGLVEVVVSVPVVLEYEDVLKRPRMVPAYSEAEIDEILNGLCAVAQRQEIHFLWRPQLRDPGDEAFLELAVAAGGIPIVTYNAAHFAGAERFGVAIRTALDVLREIGAVDV
jgi:putative PIN family toxin of toxin-antitoxin system